jgi:hypothetical protein
MNDYEVLRSMVSLCLMRLKNNQQGTLHEGQIETELDRVIEFGDYEVDRSAMLSDLERSFAILIENATSIQSNDTRDRPEAPWVSRWINEGKLNWSYWTRYRIHLLQKWAAPTVSRLDTSTTQILDTMMPPDTQGLWDQRGLVVGHIQSGKTSNYTGLICKAVDAGYKVIIVLAGAHKNLRSQTQIRLEKDFLGFKTTDDSNGERKRTGVGLLQNVSQMTDVITSRADNGDFKRSVANNFSITPGGNPLLFVIKKHVTVLKNLFEWVSWVAQNQGGTRILNVPLLMIDDECDHSSVDTGLQEFEGEEADPDYEPKAINKGIRKIIRAFGQSVYIGYTATPQANTLIHDEGETEECGEDLFPRSFIFSIPSPDNYVGPVRMFGLNSEENPGIINAFVDLEDHAASLRLSEEEGWMPPKHRIDHRPLYQGNSEVPPSLKEAIKVFILSMTIRKLRGQENAHNSMLIHVSHYVDVQHRVKEQVEAEYENVRDRIQYGDGDGESVMELFHDVWQDKFVDRANDFEGYDLPDWQNVAEKIPESLRLIKFKEINGSAGDILDYEHNSEAGLPLDAIIIGGNKLSRGLTLEGLTVSYFLRPARYYDTLMQMGRWFGYREGYLDVCRIYTTANLQNWFHHTSIAAEQIRDDFNTMVASGCTPREFGHRILNHPLMMVTSPTKMRHGSQQQVSYEGTPVETLVFNIDNSVVESNFAALSEIGATLRSNDLDSESEVEEFRELTWRNVPSDLILNFLRAYKEHPATTKVRPQYLANYIENQVRRNMLTEWTVKICQGSKDLIELTPGIQLRPLQRAWKKYHPGDPYTVGRCGSPSDEFEDMPVDSEEYQTARDRTREIYRLSHQDEGEGNLPNIPRGPGIRYARPPERGLICLYPIEAQPPRIEGQPIFAPELEGILPLPRQLVGFFISFPGDEGAIPINYIVNQVFRRQEEEGFWNE